MKDNGFLDKLKIEVQHAIDGNGKSLEEAKKLCEIALSFLNEIENKREITAYSSDKKTTILNIDLTNDDLQIFKQIVDDLYFQYKAIVHIDDLQIKRDNSILQDTHTIREIQNGKKMILTDTNIFRKYKKELKKTIEDLEQEEKSRIFENSLNPAELLGKRIKVPETNPILMYNRMDVIFLNGKKQIILNTITGFSQILLIYFMKNRGLNLTEQKIEEDLELYLKSTESRGDRSTYTAISKLRAELKNQTNKDFFKTRKDTYGNKWIFDVNLT